MKIETQMHYEEILKVLNEYQRDSRDPQNRAMIHQDSDDTEPEEFKNFMGEIAQIEDQVTRFFEISGLANQQ